MTGQQQLVVDEAKSWLGTPYRFMGDVKGVGVDCAMFLVRVFVDTGIVPPFDPRPYPPYFYMHSDEPRYLKYLSHYAHPVEYGEPGDLCAFKFGKTAGHGAIYLGDDTMIHAFEVRGVCLSEIQRSPKMSRRFSGFWRLYGR